MKNYKLLLLFLSLFAKVSISQDIDRQKFVVNYIKLPTKKLPDNIETYAVSVKNLETSWGNTLGNVYDAEKITLNGYYRLDEDADLSIMVVPDRELVFDKIKQGVSEQTYKANRTSPAVTYNAFYYTVSYYTPQVNLKLISKAGELINEVKLGGTLENANFGDFSYESAFRNETSLSRAWADQKKSFLAGREKPNYDAYVIYIASYIKQYCLMRSVSEEFSIRYVDEKKKNDYADLREAKDAFMEGIGYIAKDNIAMINKLLQPEYEKRKEKIKKAIEIWEKALSEADYKSNKARIDFKVARHINYNLALAYLWINEFAKAKEYLLVRKDEVSHKLLFNNVFAGIEELTKYIDQQRKLDSLNSWRKLIIVDDAPYVYKKKEEKAPLTAVNTKGAKSTSSPQTAKETSKTKGGTAVAKNITSKTALTSNQAENPDVKEDNIVITNITYSQLQNISAYLKKNPKIKNLNKNLQGKQGKISIEHNMPLDQLADLILKCNCGIKMEILSVNDDQVEVAIK